MTKQLVSIVIPAFRDWKRLELCLAALSKQSVELDFFEIIVVNNDPYDQPPAEFSVPSNCRICSEARPGSYPARNKGASVATGSIFAFTDADCIPDSEWVAAILKHYSSSSGVLSGRVEMFSALGNRHLNFSESYDYIFGINQEIYKESGVGATANLAVTCDDFFSVGGFDDRFLSGGDVDFCKRISENGVHFFYDEAVLVKHPLRSNLKELFIKAKRLTSGKIKHNFFKGLLTVLAPPLVRINILLFKKKAPFYIKAKAFVVLISIKLVQVSYAPLVIFAGASERK